MLRKALLVLVFLGALASCGSDGGEEATPSSALPTTTTEQELTTEQDSPVPDSDGVSAVKAGPVTVLSTENVDTEMLPWRTVAVFDLVNESANPVEVAYRVKVESADTQTTASSDGTDTIMLPPKTTTTVVVDGLDPSGPTVPSIGAVSVYENSGAPANMWEGDPAWSTSNEAVDCYESGECSVTGDLTYSGDASATPENIQVVVRRGEEIVAAGFATTEALDVADGVVIPFSGQLSSSPDLGFDGSGFTDVDVSVAVLSGGE